MCAGSCPTDAPADGMVSGKVGNHNLRYQEDRLHTPTKRGVFPRLALWGAVAGKRTAAWFIRRDWFLSYKAKLCSLRVGTCRHVKTALASYNWSSKPPLGHGWPCFPFEFGHVTRRASLRDPQRYVQQTAPIQCNACDMQQIVSVIS